MADKSAPFVHHASQLMLQLTLDFLGRQGGFRSAARPRAEAPEAPLAWKHGIRINIVRPPRARRYLLRLQPDGTARLAIPHRGSRAEALRFLERSEAWLLRQHTRWQSQHPARLPWTEGRTFLFRGEPVILRVKEAARGVLLGFADQTLKLPSARPDYREAISAHLRRLAEKELPPRTRELAQQHGLTIGRVSVRGQKSRWGSCSSSRTISLNWRLIHAPAYVIDYLIIHELMHCREMNHSARFWKLVAAACPGYREAEQWLKGTRLETLA